MLPGTAPASLLLLTSLNTSSEDNKGGLHAADGPSQDSPA